MNSGISDNCNCTSFTLTLSTGASQECVLTLLLYFLLTYDCMAKHYSNIICKFADDNHLILISTRDETSCREEVRSKTKEIIVDYRKTCSSYSHQWSGGSKCQKLIGVHISDDLSWSQHTDTASESSSMSLLPAEAKESWC